MRPADVTFELPGTTEMGRGIVAKPAGDGPHPAVLVLHELLGLNEDMGRIASEFAEAGYVALAPDFLGEGFKIACVVRAARAVKSGEGATFDRLDAAHEWLRSQPDVDADRIGIVGFCMGGGFAVLHAAHSDAKAVATFYGDVPKDPAELEGLPPCVAGYGGKDKVFGSVVNRLRSHLEALEVTNDVIDYPDAGHSYMSLDKGFAMRASAYGPMQARFNPDAAKDSWARMLAFFDTHVAGSNTSQTSES